MATPRSCFGELQTVLQPAFLLLHVALVIGHNGDPAELLRCGKLCHGSHRMPLNVGCIHNQP